MTATPAHAETTVAVLGAGPSGTTAALALARRGHHVTLIGPPPSHADRRILLSGSAIAALSSLDIDLAAVPGARQIHRIRLATRANQPVESLDFPGLTIGDHQLRATLVDAARSAGATCVEDSVTTITPADQGADLALASGRRFRTRHVVDARGHNDSANKLDSAHNVGMRWASTQTFHTNAPLNSPVLHLAIPAQHTPDQTPFAVWLIPAHDNAVTITIIHNRQTVPTDEQALKLALDQLDLHTTTPPGLTPANSASGGPLATTYNPATITIGPALPVGDAAGLVNPFTGEGMSYALDSGRHAATAITTHPTDAANSYSRALERSFVGYFETSRHAVRRYQLAWRVLAAAAHNDHPFIAKTRRAILLPEGVTGLADVARLDLDDADTLPLKPFLLACDEVLASTVRHDWPFLARMLLSDIGDTRRRLRPAILFAGATLTNGHTPDPSHATLVAAVELASLAALTFLTTARAPTTCLRGIDWATTTVILAGDYLLAEASRLVAAHSPAYSFSFAEWLDDLVAFRSSGDAITAAGIDIFETLYEFPARLGADIAQCDAQHGQALRDYARHTGRTFLHGEEVLALQHQRTRLDTTLDTLIRHHISAIPSSALHDNDERRRQYHRQIKACKSEHAHVHDHLRRLPDNNGGRLLAAFLDAAATPGLAGLNRPASGCSFNKSRQPDHRPTR
ncbi:lycopene cyclase family protein [Amycolatopsis sp. NPDC006125]|uniref:lycopene cyclase family protein n=1 Tax=Amycolatopsis sp. NPDC006125 TaxID=3156730 RepID=UPI00339FC0C0